MGTETHAVMHAPAKRFLFQNTRHPPLARPGDVHEPAAETAQQVVRVHGRRPREC